MSGADSETPQNDRFDGKEVGDARPPGSGSRESVGPSGQNADDAAPDKQAQPSEQATDDDLLDDSRTAAESMHDAVGSMRGIPTAARHVTIYATNFVGGNATIGTQVGRDNHADATNHHTATHGAVTIERLEQIRRTFAKPKAFPEIRRRMDAQSLLLLRAPEGWGRTTVALCALHEASMTSVYTLELDVELRSWEIEFSEHTGYLMGTFGPDQAAHLHRFHLERLSKRLSERGCQMIVLLNDVICLPPDLGEFLLDAGDPADAKELVHNHARYHLDRDPADTLELPEVVELLDRYTQDRPPAHVLGRLGSELADVAAGRAELTEIIDRHLTTISNEFALWFDEHLSPEARAFAIALAVFNRMPLYMVSNAARELAQVIASEEQPDQTVVWPVFGSRNSELIAAARARLYRSTENGVYGEIPVHVVEFTNPSYPCKILDRVWQEYHIAHELVRDWLRALGSSPDLRVCARAGVAAGLLSTFEFEHARLVIIEPWARSGKRSDRVAAMAALQFPFLYSDLAPLVSRMLEAWLQRDQPLALRVTAARTLGSEIGQAMPETAIPRLRRAARSTRLSLRMAVALSMAQLFWSGGLTDRILRELLYWTRPAGRHRLRDTGLRSVLDLSGYRLVRTEQNLHEWPVPLCLTGTDREAIITLFGRLIESPEHPPETYAAIRGWVDIAESDPGLREPLAGFLFDLGNALQDNELLPYYLRGWAAEPKGPRRSVQDVLTLLDSMRQLDTKELDSKEQTE
ncbi:hypothetical protein [Nocardia pseudobrasiliensis]|uniref:Uncharacterized protein n=1 Tax=Nocardia pseudobrasiliensis TaxID=45979 RepID=A0A370IFV4_9NOCA|nr:hypothetical protein [Nocardia pseudobrasiliensis]RDI69031.1 hypothetical protein DFR76_101569 [Nocardia pseudobrasiliensis]